MVLSHDFLGSANPQSPVFGRSTMLAWMSKGGEIKASCLLVAFVDDYYSCTL